MLPLLIPAAVFGALFARHLALEAAQGHQFTSKAPPGRYGGEPSYGRASYNTGDDDEVAGSDLLDAVAEANPEWPPSKVRMVNRQISPTITEGVFEVQWRRWPEGTNWEPKLPALWAGSYVFSKLS